jgi:hypothetical protein
VEPKTIKIGNNQEIIMRVVRDLIGGHTPMPISLPYNGSTDEDNTDTRYAGSLVKLSDIDDIDDGAFLTWAGEVTALTNTFGILEEEVSDGYLPNDGTYGMNRNKITPIFPSSVIRAEYVQEDKAGAAAYDTNFTGSAAGVALTCGDSITTADTFIGGWVYFINGANAGYLHYVTDSDASGVLTVSAMNGATVAGDDLLIINPANERRCLFDATYTGLKSEVDDAARTVTIFFGLEHYISAPGIPFGRLDYNKHDGLKIANARFYHDFLFVSGESGVHEVPNLLTIDGISAAS